MHRFGTANWWLPQWLDRRLPTLHTENEPSPSHIRLSATRP